MRSQGRTRTLGTALEDQEAQAGFFLMNITFLYCSPGFSEIWYVPEDFKKQTRTLGHVKLRFDFAEHQEHVISQLSDISNC